ncbi:hypothetical protein SSABA_v1c03980 [Spiroplasma sabaudiense Ar-1343]|uniref:Schlafen group 3-like DNA/RNA helicase domain-containing protein n=1 Tax=Spiroplasma sabaudiense Ar-1343 TaxID=1276257 RepID=W6A9U6_9MOLU|nr:DNA/RNA helicase domain-containing protein [Spiroplasma sabaudiense]AHI53807.1 hypothetical protein SSABA_v1c03980 [Spiroplasma sabaudiense Ar-1343]
MAISKDSFEQVGCIHTSQGIEFDYVGVIIDDDMFYENNKLKTDFNKRSKNDSSVKGLKSKKIKPLEAQFIGDKIIKNTYKTLMTRAMKSFYIYCVDKELG